MLNLGFSSKANSSYICLIGFPPARVSMEVIATSKLACFTYLQDVNNQPTPLVLGEKNPLILTSNRTSISSRVVFVALGPCSPEPSFRLGSCICWAFAFVRRSSSAFKGLRFFGSKKILQTKKTFL